MYVRLGHLDVCPDKMGAGSEVAVGAKKTRTIRVEGKELTISNPDKMMYPDDGITKWSYLLHLTRLAPWMLPHCRGRWLTTIRFPDGVHGKSFYQKNVPSHAPEWVRTDTWNEVEYILLEDAATLAWLANLACLEFHLSFDRVDAPDMPPELVFDLDPSAPPFEKVVEVAFYTKEVLDGMGLSSYVKTSGATGLQVYVPIHRRYTFEETRKVSRFVAMYLAQKYPRLITIERTVKNRGDKVYFDYLQHWRGKSLIAPYSPRARKGAPVSTPLTWEELNQGIRPEQFTLATIHGRLAEKGDLFAGLLAEDSRHDLTDILKWIPE